MRSYSPLPASLEQMLLKVEPSHDREMRYFPCRAVLKNGALLETVYFQPQHPYIGFWGIYPKEDQGKLPLRIDDVAAIENSPSRLPAQFATELYRMGESGIGYVVFTVVFSDGQRQACVSGNAVDFIHYPQGKRPADVVAVLPYMVPRDASLVKGPEYHWCLYSES